MLLALTCRRALMQEDSARMTRGVQLAGLFFLPFETYNVGPKVAPLQVPYLIVST